MQSSLSDASGTTVAAYAYDVFGTLTSTLETFSNGWSNPYRYDGRDGVRYDPETGFDWISVRAYISVLGRFARADTDAKGGLNCYGYISGNPRNRDQR
ncbi:MAG TPA: RHS repeat-associated core domain-containing protein [Rhodanobacter sp.]